MDAHLEKALRLVAASDLVSPTKLGVSTVVWGGKPAPWIEWLEIDPNGELRLEAKPPAGAILQDNPSHWTPGLFTADVKGASLRVENASSNATESVDDVVERARLEAFAWRVIDPNAVGEMKLWVTALKFVGENAPRSLRYPVGNVFLQLGVNRACRAWRFKSVQGLIFMIPSQNRRTWKLAFEAAGNGGPPTDEFVMRVVAVLSFAFGSPFHIGILRAVGEHGFEEGMAHLGLADLRPLREISEHPAIPIRNGAHLVDFVELALKFLSSDHATPLTVAFHLSGASYEGFVDAQFLMAWIAAETVSTWAIDNRKLLPPGKRRIADTRKWRGWVRQHKNEIKSLAEPGYEESLYDSILYSDYQKPSSVQRVLRDQGLWNDAMNEMERVRNLVAHEGLMCGREARDWPRDLALVTLARTLVTAIISMLIGYDGPILDQGDHRDKVPSWWRMSEWPPIAIQYDSLDRSG